MYVNQTRDNKAVSDKQKQNQIKSLKIIGSNGVNEGAHPIKLSSNHQNNEQIHKN
jgi:hypothetical protein